MIKSHREPDREGERQREQPGWIQKQSEKEPGWIQKQSGRKSLVRDRNRAAERAWLDTETERQKDCGGLFYLDTETGETELVWSGRKSLETYRGIWGNSKSGRKSLVRYRKSGRKSLVRENREKQSDRKSLVGKSHREKEPGWIQTERQKGLVGETERQRESLVGYRNRAAERAWLDTETERQKEPG